MEKTPLPRGSSFEGMARWLAGGEERTTLTLDDVTRATVIADHNHGHAPVFGSTGYRPRVRMLVQNHDLPRLCVWYSR